MYNGIIVLVYFVRVYGGRHNVLIYNTLLQYIYNTHYIYKKIYIVNVNVGV